MIAILTATLLVAFSAFAAKPEKNVKVKKTIIDKSTSLKKWKGQHTFTYQWVSIDNPGKVTIDEHFGLLKLNGDQQSDNGDKIHIDGDIVRISATSFSLLGRMEMLTAGLNDGRLCKRVGVFDFIRVKKPTKKNPKTTYRLKQKGNPCDAMGLVEDVVEFHI